MVLLWWLNAIIYIKHLVPTHSKYPINVSYFSFLFFFSKEPCILNIYCPLWEVSEEIKYMVLTLVEFLV